MPPTRNRSILSPFRIRISMMARGVTEMRTGVTCRQHNLEDVHLSILSCEKRVSHTDRLTIPPPHQFGDLGFVGSVAEQWTPVMGMALRISRTDREVFNSVGSCINHKDGRVYTADFQV